MKSIFKGKDGKQLLDWVIENGHIGSQISPTETEVAEHNLMIRLLKDSGMKILLEEDKSPKREVNLIDENLKG